MPDNRPAPHRIALLGAIAASLILVAFALGMSIASLLQDQVNNPGQVVDANDDTGTDSGTELEDDGDLWRVLGPLSDGVVVDWYAPEDWQEREPNFYLRRWWEETNGNQSACCTEYSAKVMGEVRNEGYDGDFLVANSITVMEMGGPTITVYLIEKQKSDVNPVILQNYTVNEGIIAHLAVTSLESVGDVNGAVMSDAQIEEFETPERLTSGDMVFTLVGMGDMEPASIDVTQYATVITTNEDYDLRLFSEENNNLKNELFFMRPDNRQVWYDLNVPFWDAKGESAQIPSIVWKDGSRPTEQYLKGAVGGCGFVTWTNVSTDVPAMVDAGYMSGNTMVRVYEPADYSHASLEDEYANWKFWQTNSMGDGADTSYEAFATGHSVFFYQDALDRWVEFMRSDVVPMGECGKPVIYLYPETTTDISVQLSPLGGFTKTEPAYGNGWNVIATPDGTLVNKADGLTYPYLFWEGRGGLYAEPKNYWVVAQADVPAFLDTTLAKFGFNAQEIADFKEFWVPRMHSAPYYKIGFHGVNVMNAIAPLTLSMQPDTLIRILMDYAELSEAIPSNPPRLPATPVRKGFTVTEWGGVLR